MIKLTKYGSKVWVEVGDQDGYSVDKEDIDFIQIDDTHVAINITGGGPVLLSELEMNGSTPADMAALKTAIAAVFPDASAGGGASDWGDLEGTLSDQTDLQDALDDKADLVGGVIPSAQLPAIAVTDFLGSSANEAEMLALIGQNGDWTIRTDDGKVYVITGADPTDVDDWTALTYPGGAVTSVAGRTGVVTLTADDTPDGTTNKAFTATEKTKLTGIAISATANDTDANLKARANHTGTQLAATISDFQTAVSANTDVAAMKAIIGDGISDGDAVVNTLAEMLSTFETYAEGVDIATALAAKAPLTSPTFATSITGSYLTASEILITDGSKNIVSAPVATYPSLTELAFVKGATSPIQAQIEAKGVGSVTSVGFVGGLISVGTPTATPAFTVAGTSGGIPYFSSASTWASSAALGANGIVIGGGAGAAPLTSTGLTFASAIVDNTGSSSTSIGFSTVNTSTGTAASAHLSAGNAATARIWMQARGTNYTTSGANFQDSGLVYTEANLSGGMSIAVGSTTNGLRLYTGGFTDAHERIRILHTGEVGIGLIAPTAVLHLKASAAEVGKASLKINEGTRQTTPEDGTINYVSNNLEFVETSTVYTLAKTLTATATLDFDLTAVNSQDLTITVTGAAVGDPVAIGVDAASIPADITWFGWVSAPNTVTVRGSRVGGGGAGDPASGTFRASVIHY